VQPERTVYAPRSDDKWCVTAPRRGTVVLLADGGAYR
jgi:hypothetical protein